MNAIVTTAYGSPDVLSFRQVALPVPKEDELLIRVHAVSVGPSDCAFRKGEPFLVRFLYGLRKPRLAIGGVEIAGVVEVVGSRVSRFKTGDRVMGMSTRTFGGHAEYVCLREGDPLIRMPSGLRYEQAVAICDGPPTALTFLRDTAKVKPGQRVLVNGASGAVGAAAVQIGCHLGAEVTGVCSGANAALVESLGAARVIDYTREDFTRSGEQWDVIFDAVGKQSFAQCKSALSPTGIYLTTVPSLGLVGALLGNLFSRGRQVKFVTAGLMQNQASLTTLVNMVGAGALTPLVDRCYPLEQAAVAHRYVETGRKHGTVALLA